MILTIIVSLLLIDMAWSVILKPFTIHEPNVKRFWLDRIWTIFFTAVALVANYQDDLEGYSKFIFGAAILLYLVSVSFLYHRKD